MSEMTCSSCNNIRAELHPSKSKLVPGMTLFMCQSCIDAKYLPRWVLILHARHNGINSISDYLRNRKYFGKEITGSELVH